MRTERIETSAATAEQRDALFAAVLVHDTIDLDATLPDAIGLDYGPKQFARFFALARKVWADGVDRRALAGIAAAAMSGRPIGEDDAAAFRDIRARFKQLRFAYAMFGRDHDYPAALDRVTRTMGHFQDAQKHGGRLRRATQAVALRLLTTRPSFARLVAGIDRFVPSDEARFRAYVASQTAAIRSALAMPEITAVHFHDTRKIVSRLVAMYDCVDTLEPSPVHRATVRFLSTINGLMGTMHDDMVARRLEGGRDYHGARFALPDAVATRLRRLERVFFDAASAQPVSPA